MDFAEAALQLREASKDANGEVKRAYDTAISCLEDPLLAFLSEFVPFRLDKIFGVPKEEIRNDAAVAACVNRLYENANILFNFEKVDELLREALRQVHG